MHVACIRTHLISSASAVSLVPRPEDRTRLLSSSLRSFSGPPNSPPLFCTGMLGSGWERDYISLASLYTSAVASFPGAEEGEERAPGTHCLRMRVIIAKATW